MKMRAAVLREPMKPRPYKDSGPFAIEEVELERRGGRGAGAHRGGGAVPLRLSTVNGDRPRPLEPQTPARPGRTFRRARAGWSARSSLQAACAIRPRSHAA